MDADAWLAQALAAPPWPAFAPLAQAFGILGSTGAWWVLVLALDLLRLAFHTGELRREDNGRPLFGLQSFDAPSGSARAL